MRPVIVLWVVGPGRFLGRDARGQFAFNRLLPPWPIGYRIGDVRLHDAVPPGWLRSWEPRYRNCGNRQSGGRLVVIPENNWGTSVFRPTSRPGSIPGGAGVAWARGWLVEDRT